MPDPTVTVVIPTFNRIALLRQAIESVKAQTYDDWELLVVDDGSTDQTAQYVQAEQDHRINLVRSVHHGIRRRRLTYVLMASILIALFASGTSRLYTAYKYGGLSLGSWGMRSTPRNSYREAVSYQSKPTPKKIRLGLVNIERSYGFLLFVVWGAGLMSLAHFLAARFYWWPLHPLGLLLVPSYAIWAVWSSILLGWLIKALVLKYGGGTTFRRLRPAFLGLIIGDCLIGGVWIVTGLIRGSRVMMVMPG